MMPVTNHSGHLHLVGLVEVKIGHVFCEAMIVADVVAIPWMRFCFDYVFLLVLEGKKNSLTLYSLL